MAAAVQLRRLSHTAERISGAVNARRMSPTDV
jgi:hypothetical protein